MTVVSTFPYLVVRMLAGVYARRPVVFVGVQVETSSIREGAMLVTDPDAATAVEAITPARREAVLAAASEWSRQSGLSACVVFGWHDAVYVEPDGAQHASPKPPLGGFRL